MYPLLIRFDTECQAASNHASLTERSLIKQSRIKEYRYCLGFFSSCDDVTFSARFNVKVDETVIAGKVRRSYTGFLVNHTRHARDIYRFMLSTRPIILRCDYFEGEIKLLSSSRFVSVE